jgi:peptidoglycan hydrolase-like protein with peptidoglycan-binding domain
VFLPYPASYGNSAVRMGQQQWVNFNGWAGHQHAASNDHGDPGAFPFARMIKLAAQPTGDLTVDGVLGAATIRRWQTVLNALGAKPKLAADGKLGPATWAAVQRWLGHTPANGVPGRDTIRDLERELGVAVVDGTLGRDTVRALQRWLNAQPTK